MGAECLNCWIPQMADLLVYEVVEQMSGIQLGSCSRSDERDGEMETVYGLVEGEYQMHLRFRAEPRMFSRLAKNMIGEDPQDQEEIQEYATEFFNVLCGRFVSEIYRSTKLSGRFLPTTYGARPNGVRPNEDDGECTRYFLSEEQELVEFSWSRYSEGKHCWKVQEN